MRNDLARYLISDERLAADPQLRYCRSGTHPHSYPKEKDLTRIKTSSTNPSSQLLDYALIYLPMRQSQLERVLPSSQAETVSPQSVLKGSASTPRWRKSKTLTKVKSSKKDGFEQVPRFSQSLPVLSVLVMKLRGTCCTNDDHSISGFLALPTIVTPRQCSAFGSLTRTMVLSGSIGLSALTCAASLADCSMASISSLQPA